MLAAPKQLRSQSAPLIGGLLVLTLAVIALALPPSPITLEANAGGIGALHAPSLFSDGLAEQNARNGYGYMALDVTGVSADRDALWRRQLEVVAARRFPVWAWIDVARAGEETEKLLNGLHVSGVFLYGKGAEERAAALRANRRTPVVVVHAAGRGNPREDAVLVDFDTYMKSKAGDYARPVLVADQLGAAQVRQALDHARALAGEDGAPALLIARVPLLP